MQTLTPAGSDLVSEIASRYNLSHDAVIHMLISVNNGGGTMAQFNCPELGGSGQWMSGGMTMVGDMFNNGLKNTVDNLCTELSNAIISMQIFPVIPAGTPNSSQWWPSEYGSPFSSGAQNNIRYAIFSGKLAVELNGQVTVYDTLDHNIAGVSQQQGGDTSLTFSSQFGTVSVSQLPVISGAGSNQAPPNNNFAEPVIEEVMFDQTAVNAPIPESDHVSINASSDDLIELIGKLAKLRDAGAITEQDFDAKKSELLARL